MDLLKKLPPKIENKLQVAVEKDCELLIPNPSDHEQCLPYPIDTSEAVDLLTEEQRLNMLI